MDSSAAALGAALLGALTAGCGGVSVASNGVPDPAGDASVHDAGQASDAGQGTAREHSPIRDATPSDGSLDVSSGMDASKASDASDARDVSDGEAALCAQRPAASTGADAGRCLGIFYATVERLELWIDDSSLTGGGSRVVLSMGGTRNVGAHSYGYSGNSLITSGSRLDLFLDVDGRKNAIELHLGGCAPQVGPREWDYPATFSRPPCFGCALTSIGRNYTVIESPAEGGLGSFYTFTADEPPRTCGAGIDLLALTTWPG